jgi:hypothetical protein
MPPFCNLRGGCQQKEHPLCLVFQAREGVVVVYRQKEPLHKEGESFSIKSFEFKYGKQKKKLPISLLSEKRDGVVLNAEGGVCKKDPSVKPSCLSVREGKRCRGYVDREPLRLRLSF